MSREVLCVVGSLGLAGACAAGAMAFAQGCSLRNCDVSSTFVFADAQTSPPDPPTGWVLEPDAQHVVDDTTWQSGPADGTWMDFPGQRIYTFFPLGNDGFAGPYTSITAYVSADPTPTKTPGSNYTIASGNLAEILQGDDPHSFGIHNDTCAQYYLRVVVTRAKPAPVPDAGPPPALDAGVDAEVGDASDAGTADAAVDAPSDGGVESG